MSEPAGEIHDKAMAIEEEAWNEALEVRKKHTPFLPKESKPSEAQVEQPPEEKKEHPPLTITMRTPDDGTPVNIPVKSTSQDKENIWTQNFSTTRRTLSSASETEINGMVDQMLPLGTIIDYGTRVYEVVKAKHTWVADKFGQESVFVRMLPRDEFEFKSSQKGAKIWDPGGRLRIQEITIQPQSPIPAPDVFNSKVLKAAAQSIHEKSKA